jgi:hypothetical protein
MFDHSVGKLKKEMAILFLFFFFFQFTAQVARVRPSEAGTRT